MIRQVVLALTAFSTQPSNGPRSSIRLARSCWNTSQIVRSLNSGCLVRLAPGSGFARPRTGSGDALILQPGIQFGQALHPRLGAEQLVAQIADLVLDLTLLPACRRCAGHRLDQMVRAHLQKAAVILTCLADEDRLHRRLHVVVDATPANPAVKL